MPTAVTIIGAGLGGLTLASVLQRHHIEVAVFDLDASKGARGQGGQLDLHPHSGQRALELAGLSKQFRSIVHAGGAAMRVVTRHGRVLAEKPDDGSWGSPEALRGDIRDILLASLAPGTVRWGHRLVRATRGRSGLFDLEFADGSRVATDRLVGADGVWSRVRPLVSDATPRYSGVSYIDTFLDDVDVRHPEVARAVGGGALYALEPGRGFLAHREAGDRIHDYLVLSKPEEWFAAIDFDDRATIASRLLTDFEGWAPELRALVEKSDTAPVLRSIHELPDDHRWERVPGVTLIGDAAHATVPGGEGANNAMLDGAELGLALVEHKGDADAAFAAFEPRIFARSAAAAAASHETVELIFGVGAPHRLADLVSGRG